MLKKIFLFLLTISVASHSLAGNPRAFLSYSAFHSSNDGPYLETYLLIMGNSVQFSRDADEKFRSKVLVHILFSQNGKVAYEDRYRMVSPEIADTSNAFRPSFIDQQRIALANGDYEFALEISDLNDSTAMYSSTQNIHIQFPANELAVSDIEFLESFSPASKINTFCKSGYELVPYISDFFPKEQSALRFYTEIYPVSKQLNSGDRYLLHYYIKNFSSKKILADYSVFKKEVAEPVDVLLTELDISKLPSGNYEIIIDIISSTNQILSSQKRFFQRSNADATLAETDFRTIDVRNSFVSKIHSKDSLREYVRSLRPKANEPEKSFIDKQASDADSSVLQQFIYDFCLKRDRANPQRMWNAYQEKVRWVQMQYGTLNRKGYNTDRGRVYLQYGAPNGVSEAPYEPSAYPYEVWQYYTVGPQTNRKFVFYNPDLANNEYELIHSDVFGEISDTRWQMKIFSRNNNTQNFDIKKMPDTFGGKANENYALPK